MTISRRMTTKHTFVVVVKAGCLLAAGGSTFKLRLRVSRNAVSIFPKTGRVFSPLISSHSCPKPQNLEPRLSPRLCPQSAQGRRLAKLGSRQATKRQRQGQRSFSGETFLGMQGSKNKIRKRSRRESKFHCVPEAKLN